MSSSNTAGKGDRPRNCFSKQFKCNYEKIDWHRNKKPFFSIKFKDNGKVVIGVILEDAKNV